MRSTDHRHAAKHRALGVTSGRTGVDLAKEIIAANPAATETNLYVGMSVVGSPENVPNLETKGPQLPLECGG
ncbi:hypothetical protein PV433_14230 [Paenibacillus sp. GYB004]|uniref:hypothetical protein n=1 Tax=Paenibacillus sp. GYB004 TaxID=2994393 RepID=UPI002F963824